MKLAFSSLIFFAATLIASVALVNAVNTSHGVEPTANNASGQWPQWRGPNRDGISMETGLLQSWPDDGPSIVWQAKGLGKGYASLSVAAGRIFTMGRRDGAEHLIALSAQDGSELWATKVGDGKHSNCTPTVDGNLVFALGLKGDLICADTSTGREIWRTHFGKDFGGKMMSGWGYCESPLVDGDRLICTPGATGAVIVALDKRTGKVIWKSAMPEEAGRRGKDGAGYSSVVISNAAGVKQYVQLVGRGIVSVAAKDGKLLWNYNRIANGTANIPTPLVSGDHVFCSSGYGAGAALLKIVRNGEQLKAEEVYFLTGSEMQNHHGGMILLGDHIYCGNGHGKGFPLCIEMLSGEVAWRPGRGPGGGSAAVTYADGHFYFRYENGVMALIEATPKEYKLKGTFKIATHHGKSWPHPVVVDGRLYLRDQDELHCYDIKR